VSRIPTHWSYSSWKRFAQCGYSYYLEKVERLPTMPSVASVAGRAFHSWTELYDRALDPDQIASIWEDCLSEAVAEEEHRSGIEPSEWRVSGRASKAAPDKETLDYWLFFGWELCQKYIAWRSATLWTIARDMPGENWVGIEYPVETTIGGERFVAYLDRLMYDEQGRLGVVDIKTGTQIRKEPQLDFYRAAGREVGLDIEWHSYYNARKGENTPPRFRPAWDARRIERIIEPQQELRRLEIFPIVPGEHCQWCFVKDYCVYSVTD
jgi:putative RecB family exonuclease